MVCIRLRIFTEMQCVPIFNVRKFTTLFLEELNKTSENWLLIRPVSWELFDVLKYRSLVSEKAFPQTTRTNI